MTFQVILLGISLAIFGQTLAQTTTTEWETTPPRSTWLPESSTVTATTPPAETEEPVTSTVTEEPVSSTVTEEPLETSTASSSFNCGGISRGVVMHPSECNKFVFCHQNYGWEVECPEGEIFSWKTLTCGTNNSCTEYFEGYGNKYSLESEACKRQTQSYAEHPYEFTQYVDCASLTIRRCPNNRIFRWKYQRCLPGSQATNQLQSVSANCGFWGERAHPYLCEQYFTCRVWVSSLKTCPNGSIYHASSKRCRTGSFQTCQYAY